MLVTGLAGELKLIAGVERDKRIHPVGIHNDLLVDGLLEFDGAVLHVDQYSLCNLRPLLGELNCMDQSTRWLG